MLLLPLLTPAQAWRQVRLAWWRWAWHDLRLTDPHSPDLVEIATRIHHLRR